MGFVKFEKEISRGLGQRGPAVSFGKTSGHIRFNKTAATEMGLTPSTFVTLWWDGDKEEVGVQPCKSTDEYAIPVHWIAKDGACYIAGLQFLRHFDIETAVLGLRVKPTKDAKTGMIVLPLLDGGGN